MSFIDSIEEISFKQLFWMALLTGFIITIPLTVVLVQKETKVFTKADFQPPSPSPLKRGPIPAQPPKIAAVEPFLGKEGDIIILRGENFGFYPQGAYVQIGTVRVPENHLVSWEEDAVSFYLPTAARSDKVSIHNGRDFTTWPRILTVYSTETKTKITLDSNQMKISFADSISRIVYYDQAGERYETNLTPPVTNGATPTTVVGDLQYRKISWITIFNTQNTPSSFYVMPEQFGF